MKSAELREALKDVCPRIWHTPFQKWGLQRPRPVPPLSVPPSIVAPKGGCPPACSWNIQQGAHTQTWASIYTPVCVRLRGVYM